MKLGAADFALADDFNFCNTWGVKRENALNALAIGNFTDSESGVDTGSAFSDYDTSENLNALFSAFNNAAMNFDSVANIE